MNIALVGSLDTKGEEYGFLRDEIEKQDRQVVVIDVGILDDPLITPDLSREMVAERSGFSLEDLQNAAERGTAMRAMADGATRHLQELIGEGRVAAVLAVGGSNAAYIMARICESLPVGFPKVLLSTMASGDTRPYVGSTDLTMMNPIADINGINRITKPMLKNAALATTGMASRADDFTDTKPVVAVSMFGVTTPCASSIANLLSDEYEPVSFHANGSGGLALEALVRADKIDVVADMTLTELADEHVGGVCSAGPDRLTAAGQLGIPQVVSFGALDMVNFGNRQSVPAQFEGRLIYEHNPQVTLMRTTPVECAELGKILAQRLNDAQGHRSVVIPLQGFSMLSVEGGPFRNQAADRALIDSFHAFVSSEVEVHVMDTDINHPAVADTMYEIIKTIPLRSIDA